MPNQENAFWKARERYQQYLVKLGYECIVNEDDKPTTKAYMVHPDYIYQWKNDGVKDISQYPNWAVKDIGYFPSKVD